MQLDTIAPAPHPQAAPMATPRPARAVFSTEDFRLLRIAVSHYAQAIADQPDCSKYAHLLHRLGRVR